MSPIEKLHSLSAVEQRAFLSLVSGSIRKIDFREAPNGELDGGKAVSLNFARGERGWMPDWKRFYSRTLPELGLTSWAESDRRPMYDGIGWFAEIGITHEGVRAYCEHWAADAIRAQLACEVTEGAMLYAAS